jgi:Mn-dependent DtxR family transcriptional regulator
MRYTPPHVQLAELLAQARREGRSFEDAWAEALNLGGSLVTRHRPADRRPPRGVVFARDTDTRSWEREALLATKREWWRSYHRLPPDTRALERLGDLATAMDGLSAIPLPPEHEASAEARVMALMRRGEVLSVKLLAMRMGIGEPTARRITQRLREQGEIHCDEFGRYRLGAGDPDPPVRPSLLRAAVLEALGDGETWKLQALAERAGTEPRTVNRVLATLTDEGLVTRKRFGHYALARARAPVAV